ncbi:hypothetical protein KKF84_18860 [Myxococcota bacterium]|nr:hypothetical protein [Myxococcota bacterium]
MKKYTVLAILLFTLPLGCAKKGKCEYGKMCEKIHERIMENGCGKLIANDPADQWKTTCAVKQSWEKHWKTVGTMCYSFKKEQHCTCISNVLAGKPFNDNLTADKPSKAAAKPEVKPVEKPEVKPVAQ